MATLRELQDKLESLDDASKLTKAAKAVDRRTQSPLLFLLAGLNRSNE